MVNRMSPAKRCLQKYHSGYQTALVDAGRGLDTKALLAVHGKDAAEWKASLAWVRGYADAVAGKPCEVSPMDFLGDEVGAGELVEVLRRLESARGPREIAAAYRRRVAGASSRRK